MKKSWTDLDRGSDGDTHRQLHLALHGHPDGGDVLGGVPDEREEDQTDERLRNTKLLARLVNRRDEEVGTKGGEEGDSEKSNDGRPEAHGRLLLLLLALLSDEQLGVRL